MPSASKPLQNFRRTKNLSRAVSAKRIWVGRVIHQSLPPEYEEFTKSSFKRNHGRQSFSSKVFHQSCPSQILVRAAAAGLLMLRVPLTVCRRDLVQKAVQGGCAWELRLCFSARCMSMIECRTGGSFLHRSCVSECRAESAGKPADWWVASLCQCGSARVVGGDKSSARA